MKVPNLICNEIKEYCLKNKDREVCGFIIDKNSEILFVPISNKHPDPENFFLISPDDYLQIKATAKILYLFHSHPKNASFSNFDLKYQKYHNINMLLYNIEKDLFEEKSVNIN
jgi:proteasome lid subunit RPN8/RPN11